MQSSVHKEKVSAHNFANGCLCCSIGVTKGHKKQDMNSKDKTLRTHRIGR